jgi:hypothetical protein
MSDKPTPTDSLQFREFKEMCMQPKVNILFLGELNQLGINVCSEGNYDINYPDDMVIVYGKTSIGDFKNRYYRFENIQERTLFIESLRHFIEDMDYDHKEFVRCILQANNIICNDIQYGKSEMLSNVNIDMTLSKPVSYTIKG